MMMTGEERREVEVRRVITRCVINGGCLGRWLGGGREGDYTMCNQWWVLVLVFG